MELAWTADPRWGDLVMALKCRHPQLQIGAASITELPALERVAELDIGYAMSPLLDPALQARADALDCLLVPGVMTPSRFARPASLAAGWSSCFRPACWVAGFVAKLRRRWVRFRS